MADETDTRDETSTPKPPRRRTPRASSRSKAAEIKAEPAKVEDAPKRTRQTAAKPESAAKPAAKTASAKRTPAKPRAAKRQTPAPKRRKAEPSTVEKTTRKVGGGWAAAAIAGGVAAVGAAAALLTLRGSSAKVTKPESTGSTRPVPVQPSKPAHAHTADGTDASKSFDAGIADENTIPEA